ncbi:hypothetical protein [Pectobacterium carotovorum]|uniref:hypothetical protein n=1 Tax=Pectobacterium carotovorum TaxID=554 RepID=UPI001E3749C3|nr:hypothetical protein [Pectobacterium carotovorum]UFT95770.1 hypothetical protein LQF52_07055 [Pectobacterium carotovorum]
MKTNVLVVLYSKECDDSTTLNSLINLSNVNTTLTVFNNGPLAIKKDSVFLNKLKKNFSDLVFIEDLNNKPLSCIYNDFLKNSLYSRYVIFDDDTIVPMDYLSYVNNNDVDIRIPIIKSKAGKIVYPKKRGGVLDEEGIYDDNDFIYTVGSGLVIYKTLINKFFYYNNDLFDERYALYGVDVSLFRRINLIKNKGCHIKIQIANIISHSMSNLEEKPSEFRRVERLIDNVITLRSYPESFSSSFFFFIRMLFKRFLLFRYKEVFIMFKILMSGVHPRCNNVSKSEGKK